MPQQERPRAPTGLREADEQPPARLGERRVNLLDQRHDDVDEVRFLGQPAIGRVIGIPGERGERRLDDDRVQAIRRVHFDGRAQAVAEAAFAPGLHRQEVDDRPFLRRARRFPGRIAGQ
jgi:hypothetical protein